MKKLDGTELMELTEKLNVRDFDPLTDVEMDFKRIMPLIGSSASGKSTLLRIIAIRDAYFALMTRGKREERIVA